MMARASQRALNKALGEGLTGQNAGHRAEQIFETYALQMQKRLMATNSPYRITMQPASSALTGDRILARSKTSFAGRWRAGAKRLDYGFYSVYEGQANSARILSGADFTVTTNGALGIPKEYASAFPEATIFGIDPRNITRSI
jgi:hypothetical protein